LKEKIKILLVCEFVLFRKGLVLILSKEASCEIIGEVHDINQIDKIVGKSEPDVIILNLSSIPDSIVNTCKNLFGKYPNIPLLLFLDSKIEISIPETIIAGVRGIIWKENTKDELIEAIKKVGNGKLFFENPDNCRLSCHLSTKIEKVQEAKCNHNDLSFREMEVLRLIADGLTYKEVAKKLFISPRTVETHKNNIMTKLDFRNLNEIIRYAIVNKI
jgi:two-component system response regulator NreC